MPTLTCRFWKARRPQNIIPGGPLFWDPKFRAHNGARHEKECVWSLRFGVRNLDPKPEAGVCFILWFQRARSCPDVSKHVGRNTRALPSLTPALLFRQLLDAPPSQTRAEEDHSCKIEKGSVFGAPEWVLEIVEAFHTHDATHLLFLCASRKDGFKRAKFLVVLEELRIWLVLWF